MPQEERCRLQTLPQHAREMASLAIEWMDRDWDQNVHLLLNRDESASPTWHDVRSTVYYAAGLLLRNHAGDGERACQALHAILDQQFDAPGQVYHGTFRLFPEADPPAPEPLEWYDYDPNWREFLCTSFALILYHYEQELPQALIQRIDNALRQAVLGTLARPVAANYTNIALMKAFLLDYAAERLHEPAWAERAEHFAREIAGLFQRQKTFEEFNSPTYYGVDLYALALWCRYAPSPLLRELGQEMYHHLWEDIALFYHASLKNLAGPYDRSYGMDMQQYISLVGLWIWLGVGETAAPIPNVRHPFGHASDFCMATVLALLGEPVPADVLPHLQAFQGERQVERVIVGEPTRRVATAWLTDRLMLGGEATNGSGLLWTQFHAATIHWQMPRGTCGWVRFLPSSMCVDARASQHSLALAYRETNATEQAFTFRIGGLSASELESSVITHACWQLPGLTLEIETEAEGPEVEMVEECLEIRYIVHPQEGISEPTCSLRTILS